MHYKIVFCMECLLCCHKEVCQSLLYVNNTNFLQIFVRSLCKCFIASFCKVTLKGTSWLILQEKLAQLNERRKAEKEVVHKVKKGVHVANMHGWVGLMGVV